MENIWNEFECLSEAFDFIREEAEKKKDHDTMNKIYSIENSYTSENLIDSILEEYECVVRR